MGKADLAGKIKGSRRAHVRASGLGALFAMALEEAAEEEDADEEEEEEELDCNDG